MEEKGPHGFSLREAARKVGVSSGAPYRHFPDRQALMTAVAQEGMGRLNEHLASALAEVEPTPMAMFRAQGLALVRFAVDHPSFFRVVNTPESWAPSARRSSPSS